MATSRTVIAATPEAVFDLLVAPATYPRWLVGCQRIRGVDGDWPQPGSAFHHVVGGGPLRVADRTAVVAIDRPWRLVLDVRARPIGRGQATFTVQPVERAGEAGAAGGDGGAGEARTEVTVEEHPTSPVLRRLRPLVEPATRRRNDVSLDQLRRLVDEDRGRLRRFPFRHEGVAGAVARFAGARGRRAEVELDDDELRVRFGAFRLSTPRANVCEVELGGPYHWWRVAGPVRVSVADRGLTFASTAREGACLAFRQPVACRPWSRQRRHPAVTVTVADPAGLAEAVRAPAPAPLDVSSSGGR